MAIRKIIKDHVIKWLNGPENVPRGLLELNKYFRHNGSIGFKEERQDGHIIAISTNFRHGSIIVHGATKQELEKNIPDAILTSFEIPSSYRKEAKIQRVGKKTKEYALA